MATQELTMTPSPKFWDKIAERYSKKPVPDQAAYEKKLKVTREYFRPDMEVFEFGCGTGSTAIAHAPYVRHIRATDISSKMIEIARGKARDGNVDNVTFEQATFGECRVADASVDAVLGLSILHLLEDKDAAVAKVHRVLKPGGVFVTSTPCIGDAYWWFRYVGPLGRFFGVMPYVNIFTRADLEASLDKAGFEIDYEWQPDLKKPVFLVARKSS